MWYEKRLQDLTVGDLEGLTLEQIAKVIESIPVPDYDKNFRAARKAAEALFEK